MGVNLVSLGIFSWGKIELSDGVFDFGWLDKVIDILYDHGVYINLGTGTATTPAWFVRKYPDSLPTDESGVILSFGSRQHYCPNHPQLIMHIKSNYLGRLLEQVFAKHHINPALEVVENVEMQQRETDEWKYLIIINHNDYEVTVSLPKDKTYQNMIDGKCFRGGELRIQRVDVAVLREHDEAGKFGSLSKFFG
ncbi:beta-galactosidase [Geobacillus sp. TFV-3]|uniref:beta-galactosidase n=1 Tax=Geobacillus sp. TFV-3 TaxID=1897059 RepID=UPI001F46AE88|nr:beta-galactosidase [Geobacillus sp. TFV-3]